MNTQIKMVGGFAALLLLVGAGCGAAKQANVDANVNTEPAPQTEVGTETETTAIAAGQYNVQAEESTVTWFGKRTVGNQHRGTVELTDGTVTFDESGMLTAGSFTVDMDTIEESEDNQMLERHLRSDDFFAVETYATSSFVVTGVTAAEGDNMYEVTGDLTIKGITNSITFTATIMSQTEGTVTATATFLVDRAAFDVRYGSGSFFDDLGDSLIEDNMEFTLDLVATMGDGEEMNESEEDETSEDAEASPEEEMGVSVEADADVEISL